MFKTFEDILETAKNSARRKVAVAAAHDEDVLQSLHQATKMGLADAILIGDKKLIYEIAEKLGIDVSGYEIIKEVDTNKAIRIAVDMVGNGSADILMKGMVQTGDILKVVLDKETGLRSSGVVSHLGVMEIPNYHKFLLITDCGLNIEPDLKQKAGIIQNAVDTAICLGISKPKVAVLSAIEIINPAIQSTVDAAVLSKMAERGQIRDCFVDGPLAMDIAIDAVAAKHKGIVSEVAGDADILVVPNIDAGNILYKTLVFLTKVRSCGIVVGARAPIVATSRADDYMSKLSSIALASVLAKNQKR